MKKIRKTRTLAEKQLWNEAIGKATKEILNWDGIIPNLGDRHFMSEFIYDRFAYKIKQGENQDVQEKE